MDEPPFACSAVGVTRFYFSKRRFFFLRINAPANSPTSTACGSYMKMKATA